EVVTAAATQVAAASAPIPAAKPKVLKIAVALATRKRKGVAAKRRKLSEEAQEADNLRGRLEIVPDEDDVFVEAYKQIDWNVAFDHVQAKETQYIKRYHGFKKKPRSKSEARKNMISYLKNIKGEEMEKEDEEIIKSINETPAQKAAKRRKLSEEAQEADNLRGRLEIIPDEYDDVFVEAYKQIDWNAAFDHVQAKKTHYIKRYHGLKKKPQSESEARKNMISYLKNTEGFDDNMKFLFKSREEMEKEDEEIIKSINETPA
nr:hypothetical protein [Tanacetum cinerariifolium]